MKKIYRKLTRGQRERGIVFSSCLSGSIYECGTIHEVAANDPRREEKICNLKDDSFFDDPHCPYKYNIIRT